MKLQSERGQILAELGVLLPLLSLLLMGILYFGFAFFTYNKLDRGVHEAARYACTRTLLNSAAGHLAYRTQVRNVAIYGNPQGTGNPQVSGLNPQDIAVNFLYDGTPSSTSRPARVEIKVTTYAIPGLFKAITLSDRPWAIFPYLGNFNPI